MSKGTNQDVESTKTGVKKNSLSENLQSMIKNVPPGSKFAALQRQGGAPTPEEVGFTQDGVKKGSVAAEAQAAAGNVVAPEEVGFTQDGVKKGSVAAEAQAAAGNVVKGSAFAAAQSEATKN